MKLNYVNLHLQMLIALGIPVGLIMIKNRAKDGEYFLIDRHVTDGQVHLMRWSGGHPSNIDRLDFLSQNEPHLGSVQIMKEGKEVRTFDNFAAFLRAIRYEG